MIGYQKDDADEKANVSAKWVLMVVLSVLSNAMISILGRIQVGRFDGEYKNEYLMISLGGAAVLLILLGLIFERDKFVSTIKQSESAGSWRRGLCNAKRGGEVLRMVYPWDEDWSTEIK